jgi:hypothetical protein
VRRAPLLKFSSQITLAYAKGGTVLRTTLRGAGNQKYKEGGGQ